jgi:hypothetical protein
MKYTVELDTFTNTEPYRVSYVLSSTVNGMTHIKIIFSFLPGTDNKHFIGHALCGSDDSVMQLYHVLHFFMINSVFYKPHVLNQAPHHEDITGGGGEV